MAVVKMHIDKFGGVVTINDDHPLAVAQKAKDAKGARVVSESSTDSPPKKKPSKKKAKG